MMNMDTIQKLTMNIYMKQHILKVQPVKKFMTNIKEKKMSFLKKIHEICKGEKMNDKIGGDDVVFVEESEMRLNTGSVNGYDDSVSGFDASTFSGDNIYEFLRTRTKLSPKIQLFR